MKKPFTFILLTIFLSVWLARAEESACGIKCMQSMALSGDQHAARNLAIIYGKIDLRVAKYWHMVGAENGDPIAQYNYAIRLMDEGNDLSKKRAVFWLRRSAQAGDKDAIAAIKNLEAPLRRPAIVE